MPMRRMYVALLTQRHAVAVALCRITSAEQLTAQLQQRQIRTKDEVLAHMQKQALDEEIVTGASTLKLTCPLTYVRMVTPCRSDLCEHIQCFDAQSFFSLNEQSPQWLCPVCNQTVQAEQLRLDGYVEDILQRVPTDVDTVLVESDGSWHTSDGKYTDTSPVLQAPPRSVPPPAEESVDSMDLGDFLMDEDDLLADGDASAHDPVLGSDMPTPTPPPMPAERTADVIDLTFDSDDE